MREHLVKGIPNWWLCRSIVFYINGKMRQADSIYRLRIRYRCPKVGGYSWGGSVRRDNAKKFSLYIRYTLNYRRRLYNA